MGLKLALRLGGVNTKTNPDSASTMMKNLDLGNQGKYQHRETDRCTVAHSQSQGLRHLKSEHLNGRTCPEVMQGYNIILTNSS